MKNNSLCENCGKENAFHNLTCSGCGAYLRNRVVNINFWEMTWELFGSPAEGFRKVIFAEHKNFIIMLTILIALKFYFFSLSFKNLFISPPEPGYFYYNLLISYGYFLVILLFTAFISFKLLKLLKLQTLYKNIYSILIYSFIPIFLGLIILTPLEFAIFGRHWFIHNPGPFEINPVKAWALMGTELLMILWTLFLLIKGFYIQTSSLLFSLLWGILIFAAFFSLLVLPHLPF